MMQSTEALRERLLEVDDQSIMVDSVNGANDFSRVAPLQSQQPSWSQGATDRQRVLGTKSGQVGTGTKDKNKGRPRSHI